MSGGLEPETLTPLIAWMKREGVLHLKWGAVEILLGAGHLPPASAPNPKQPPAPAAPSLPGAPKRPAVLDDPLLFAATEGMPEE